MANLAQISRWDENHRGIRVRDARYTQGPVLLGFTTKQIHFSGDRKKFRIRYDKVVDFEPFGDGFGIMRDAQTAKPQSFRTGDCWFACNLDVNLAQM